jgi:hypothetical protein
MSDEPKLPDGWGHVDSEGFVAQLRREVSKGHQLYGHTLQAIAKRDDRDDALFRGPSGELFVVHLTWRQGAEPPPWPLIVWESTAHTMEEFAAWSAEFYDPGR